MSRSVRPTRRVWRAVARRVAILGIPLVGVAACEGILDVELPSKVGAGVLDDPSIAATLVSSAVGSFECAFTNYVPASGELTDELRHSSAWATYTYWDHRLLFPTFDTNVCEVRIGYGVYGPLQQARVIAEDAITRIEGWSDAEVPLRTEKLATLAVYAAYARTLLGEAFCEMAIDVGPLMTPAEVLESAEARFTEAIAYAQAANAPAILNMARVGRARVRLNLGKTAEALADATLVPQGFAAESRHSGSDPTRFNKVYGDNYIDGFISVSLEFVGLTFGGVADPRVVVVPGTKKGHDQSDIYLQTKYTAYTSPIRIASWEEAQLIIAEIQGGQTAVDIINALHTAAGLPAFSSTDPIAIRDQVREERRRELFLEGHRLNDMIRWSIPFATGQSPYSGVTYGTTTCMPLPQRERDANPNF
jgi:hypothetical protein